MDIALEKFKNTVTFLESHFTTYVFVGLRDKD